MVKTVTRLPTQSSPDFRRSTRAMKRPKSFSPAGPTSPGLVQETSDAGREASKRPITPQLRASSPNVARRLPMFGPRPSPFVPGPFFGLPVPSYPGAFPGILPPFSWRFGSPPFGNFLT